ncbi:unnamed protein product [Cercopithifilaria johnstoni]|uniref:Uncharacterized protein n=1 Tax=Cercopithifilaria johnstoni TaxID=2874296 RepID=A0A8J2Q9S9_9BILA|nr:unnamed protein product [Cercopithifilaria johnstoni]
MSSRVQAALIASAVTSSSKVPYSVHTERHRAPAAGIYAHSQRKHSLSPVYSVRQGTNGTTSTTGVSHTDRLQVQKMLVVFHVRKIFGMLLIRSYDVYARL